MYTIGAFAILFDDRDRVLLCHRRDMDMWNLPGGGVESGELPTEAAIRETREETGWEVLVGPRESSVLPKYLNTVWGA